MHAAKIDHGKSGVGLDLNQNEYSLMRSLINGMSNFGYGNTAFRANKFKEALNEIDSISDEEIDYLVQNRIDNLKKTGFKLPSRYCYTDIRTKVIDVGEPEKEELFFSDGPENFTYTVKTKDKAPLILRILPDRRFSCIYNEEEKISSTPMPATINEILDFLSSIGYIQDEQNLRYGKLEKLYLEGLKRQKNIFKAINNSLDIIIKIDGDDEFKRNGWLKKIYKDEEHPIGVACINNFTIEGQDPILWAINKNFKIEGRDPFIWALSNNIRIEGENPRDWAIKNNQLINEEDLIVSIKEIIQTNPKKYANAIGCIPEDKFELFIADIKTAIEKSPDSFTDIIEAIPKGKLKFFTEDIKAVIKSSPGYCHAIIKAANEDEFELFIVDIKAAIEHPHVSDIIVKVIPKDKFDLFTEDIEIAINKGSGYNLGQIIKAIPKDKLELFIHPIREAINKNFKDCPEIIKAIPEDKFELFTQSIGETINQNPLNCLDIIKAIPKSKPEILIQVVGYAIKARLAQSSDIIENNDKNWKVIGNLLGHAPKEKRVKVISEVLKDLKDVARRDKLLATLPTPEERVLENSQALLQDIRNFAMPIQQNSSALDPKAIPKTPINSGYMANRKLS